MSLLEEYEVVSEGVEAKIALAMETILCISFSSLRLINGRMCMQPTEQWP